MYWLRAALGFEPMVTQETTDIADDLPPNLRRNLNTDFLVHWNPETGELVYEPYDKDL
jgi:hypothetical protein